MKPITAVQKSEYCEWCGGVMLNGGIAAFSCNQQLGNEQYYTSPCTKEDYAQCPMNRQARPDPEDTDKLMKEMRG